jgi:DNA repair exonuclease SbcCD ATPase subunit
MIPKRVLLENFLSFGQPAVEIEFTDNEPLWVICGPNGVGKSAIFDAVTYALFASHRGGVKNSEQLIRHGANGFRIEFDFELNGRDYRIARTKAARTTQRVYSRIAGTDEWEPEPIGNAAPDVKRWVETHIGLEFEAFKASVLLRQGEADAILTATGSERLALLKTIIGADRFEHISDRIHDDLKEFKDELERLRLTLDNAAPVSEEDLAAARTILAESEERRKVAHERNARAGELLAGAKRWNVLITRKAGLESSIAEARERAEQAESIRANQARLEALTTNVPKLRTIFDLRERIQRTEAQLSTLGQKKAELKSRHEAILNEITAAVLAKETNQGEADRLDQLLAKLRDNVVRETKSLSAAEDLGKLQAELRALPIDLPQQLSTAEVDLQRATEAAQKAGESKATTAELLKQAEAKECEFAKVGVGVACSLCGQIVDAIHAEKERAVIARQVGDLQQKLKADANAAQVALEVKNAFEEKRDELSGMEQQRLLLTGKLQTMQNLGIASDAADLRRQLEEKTTAIAIHERRLADERRKQKEAATESERLDQEREPLERLLADVTGQIRSNEIANTADSSQRTTLFDQLPSDWQARSNTLDLAGIEDLASESKRLGQLGIADKFEKLKQDAALVQEWTKQLADTNLELDDIPVDARLSTKEVESQNRIVAEEITSAESARDDAKTRLEDLERRVTHQRELTAVVRTAERKLDLQKKLDELLGKKGLQRELVRAAERDIVVYARDTLDKLSDGDLTLELAEGEDADTAFDLRVLRAEDPTPIGVSFLSGSQKFRVAVSIALAIGRFASGQARPLESVIIDEGFGSLDREGLRAMADELNRLRTFLRRIVLVSHQEEFADRFPVGIRLSASDHGTVAEPFRR